MDTGLESRSSCPKGMKGSHEIQCTWIGASLRGRMGPLLAWGCFGGDSLDPWSGEEHSPI